MGVPPGEPRHPRGERARQRDVRAIEARAQVRERREVRRDVGRQVVRAEGVGREHEHVRPRVVDARVRRRQAPHEQRQEREPQRGRRNLREASRGQPHGRRGAARAIRPAPPPGARPRQEREPEQRGQRGHAPGVQRVRREHLHGAPPPALRVPRRHVELRGLRHRAELEQRVHHDDEREHGEPSPHGPWLCRRGSARRTVETREPLARGEEALRRPAQQQPEDHRCGHERGHRAGDLRAEPPLDHGLDLPRLRAELLRVVGGRARRPEREEDEVRGARERGLREASRERPQRPLHPSDLVKARGCGSRGAKRAERSATRRPIAFTSSRGRLTRAPYGAWASWQKNVRHPNGRDA